MRERLEPVRQRKRRVRSLRILKFPGRFLIVEAVEKRDPADEGSLRPRLAGRRKGDGSESCRSVTVGAVRMRIRLSGERRDRRT